MTTPSPYLRQQAVIDVTMLALEASAIAKRLQNPHEPDEKARDIGTCLFKLAVVLGYEREMACVHCWTPLVEPLSTEMRIGFCPVCKGVREANQ